MRVQILSDVHIESFDGIPDVRDFIRPVADTLILAGDVGHHYKREQWFSFLKELCGMFKTVLYVLGNHEYYINEKNLSMSQVVELVEAFRKENPNLILLNKATYLIPNGAEDGSDVVILGCTLWSRIQEIPQHFLDRIPEMDLKKYSMTHQSELMFIENTIKACRNTSKLVIVTHYCPVLFANNPLYETNLEHLLTREQVHTWVYGHTHDNRSFTTRGGTNLVTNQRGKRNGVFFSKEKVIIV